MSRRWLTKTVVAIGAVLAASLAGVTLAQSHAFQSDPPKGCASCAGWNEDLPPFKVYGNTYYVGTAGLSAVLVTSNDGHILLDGALPESAALIDRHIRALGFRTEDIELIVNSHGYFDHAGGIRALQRASGAALTQ